MEIILTQMHLPAGTEQDAAIRTVIDHGTPDAEISVVYQSVDDEMEYGLVQYLRSGSNLQDHAFAPSDVAQYFCTELTDSGPTEEIAPILMIVAFNVPIELASGVEAWYRDEHIPMLTSAAGWLRARRYEVLLQHNGPVFNSIALHELRDETVLDSPERKAARSTPWRARFSSDLWFQQAGRWVYRRIGSEGPYIG